MDRWNDLSQVPQDAHRAVVSIGNFDGVHRGHRAVLREAVTRARASGARSVAVTFDPHPLVVLRPEVAPEALTDLDRRLALLAETGVDAALVLPFTRGLAAWSPERFVETVLVEGLRACAVVVGRDMRFGRRNSGDVGTLRALGARHGFEVVVVPDTGIDAAPQASPGVGDTSRRWSSTWVRELVAAGEVETALDMLGRPHRVTGLVVHGDHRGRTLGFPTANLAQDSAEMVPADGVYAGWLIRRTPQGEAQEGRLPAAVSIGTNPTFGGMGRRVEAHVLDRDDLDLYGEAVAVEFVRRLRPMVRFEDVEELKRQMRQDVEDARRVLGVAAARA